MVRRAHTLDEPGRAADRFRLASTIALGVAFVCMLATTNAGGQAKYDGATASKPLTFVGHKRHKDDPQPMDGDAFLNYDGVDHDAQGNPADPTRLNRDWPITIVWKHNASKKNVRKFLGLDVAPSPLRSGPRGGQPIDEYYRPRSKGKQRPRNVDDGGQKSECPSKKDPKNVHIRFYGAIGDEDVSAMYDPTSGGWGAFIVSSTHFDYQEEHDPDKRRLMNRKTGQMEDNPCWSPKDNPTTWFGLSEVAARIIENQFVEPDPDNHFGDVHKDHYETQNWEGDTAKTPEPQPHEKMEPAYRVNMTKDTDHRWQNDSLATVIKVN